MFYTTKLEGSFGLETEHLLNLSLEPTSFFCLQHDLWCYTS